MDFLDKALFSVRVVAAFPLDCHVFLAQFVSEHSVQTFHLCFLRGGSAYVCRKYQEPKLRASLYSSQPPGCYGIQPKRPLDIIEFQPCTNQVLVHIVAGGEKEKCMSLFEFF